MEVVEDLNEIVEDSLEFNELNEIVEDSYEGFGESAKFNQANEIIENSYGALLKDSSELKYSSKIVEDSCDSCDSVQDSFRSKESNKLLLIEDSHDAFEDLLECKESNDALIVPDSYDVLDDQSELSKYREDSMGIKESLGVEVSKSTKEISKNIDKKIDLNVVADCGFDLNKFPDEELEEDTYEDKEIKQTIRTMRQIFFPTLY
ncbi:hypothetical protein ACFE04_023379 [Oxalis oulophora]